MQERRLACLRLTLSQIDHVGVMLQVVGHGVAEIFSFLSKSIELDLSLIVGNRCVLGAPYSIPLLINCVEQAEGVAIRLEVIEVGPVFYLASEILVLSPQDGGGHIT